MGTQELHLVLLSGGLDSSAALYQIDGVVSALFVDYGQRAVAGEQRAARAVAAQRNIPLEVLAAPAIAGLGAGDLVGAPPAEGSDGMSEQQRQEWFPLRNLLLLTLGAIMVARQQSGVVVVGATDGVYADTRTSFFLAAGVAIKRGLPDQTEVAVAAPPMSRMAAISSAKERGLDLRLTFSCNIRGDRHCWRCASCRDRAMIFGL